MPNSKVFTATAEGHKVFVNGQEVPQVNILSQGKAASSGIMILNGTDKVYIAIPVDNLKQILDLVINLANSAASGILAENGGGSITTPTFAADMADIALSAAELKDNLQ